MAKPSPYKGPRQVAPDRVHRHCESQRTTALDQRPTFLLIEAPVHIFEAGARRVACFLTARRQKRDRKRKKYKGPRSFGDPHERFPRGQPLNRA
jgi:hypothetical protein